jgi:uncharacterized membrane protein HdeD (DUF308 family)
MRAIVVPSLTEDTPRNERVSGQRPVLNSHTINVRLTHPSLYRMMMASGALSILLGFNFVFLHPAFLIYDQSNYLWGVIFLVLGASKILFLNVRRNLRLVRMSIAVSFVYVMCIAYGTCQPFIEDTGSLQLPLLYAGWAMFKGALLLEPFINPWTARRAD